MDAFVKALASEASGRLLPSSALTDFGGLRRATPRAQVVVSTEDEAQRSIQVAAAFGVDVHFRGSGHSLDGQSLGHGLVLVNRSPTPQVRMLSGHRVCVTGRTLWGDLERTLNAVGRTSPVLTDYLDLTVGGTLSVGGYGVRSVTHGAQFEHVERIRVIDRRGAVTCLGREDPGFAGSIASLGRGGLIEAVVLDTLPLPQQEYVCELRHPDLEGLIDTVTRLPTLGLDGFSAWIDRGHFVSELVSADPAVFHSTEAKRLEGERRISSSSRYARLLHNRRVAWLSGFGSHFRIWTDYKVPVGAFGAFARRIRALESSKDFEHLAVQYLLASAVGPSRGTLAPTDSGEGFYAGMGLYFMVPERAPDGVKRARRGLRRALDACLELGGRPYLYGYAPLTDDEWKQLYE